MSPPVQKWLMLLALAAPALGGCASLRGSQDWVTADDLKRFGAVCPSEEQLKTAHPGETNGQYRDRIIMVCVKAIDTKYGQFTKDLSREAGITNLGTDLVAQGLATAASVVDPGALAKKFAAASALSLGVGASANKDLYYKQTLPAIVASMDAQRSKVLTAIAKAQNTDPDATVYTLARAGFDLDLLQQAGSLNSAVRELTTAAVNNATQADLARQRAARTIDIGIAQPVPPELRARYRAAITLVRKLEAANKDSELRSVATALGLAPSPDDSLAYVSGLIRGEASEALYVEGTANQDQAMHRVEVELAKHQGAVP